jgi:hypothetical protein
MAKFKARKISIILDDPDDCQEFMNGLILAKQNNNSAYFPQLIEGVNAVMEPYLAQVREELARGIGPDAKSLVSVE